MPYLCHFNNIYYKNAPAFKTKMQKNAENRKKMKFMLAFYLAMVYTEKELRKKRLSSSI